MIIAELHRLVLLPGLEGPSDMPGVLLNPRREDGDESWGQTAQDPRFREQVEWELAGHEQADRVAFYFAPDTRSPVTLLELGLCARAGKALVCCPRGFWRKGNVDVVCGRYDVPQVADLAALVEALRHSHPW